MMRDRTQPIDTINVNDDNTFNYVFNGKAGFIRSPAPFTRVFLARSGEARPIGGTDAALA